MQCSSRAQCATAGCGKYSLGILKAMKAFKDANDHYRGQDWKEAAEQYEAGRCRARHRSDPDFRASISSSATATTTCTSRPAGRAGERRLHQKAIENYTKAAEHDHATRASSKLALQYLVAAYGPDKLNDPAQAEPIVQQMIAARPERARPTTSRSSKIYEDAGRYDEAEQALLKASDVKPNDPAVYTTLSGYYNRQGDFEKTIEALEQGRRARARTIPRATTSIATFYWDKVRKDFRLTPAAEEGLHH